MYAALLGACLWAPACGGASGSPDAGPADAQVLDAPPEDGPPPLPGQHCTTAFEIAATGSYTGDTAGSVSERTATCSDGAHQAPEVYYRVDLGDTPVDLLIDVEVEPQGEDLFDVVVSARADCDDIATELGCADRGFASEHLELVDVHGEITLLVDGTSQYGGQPSGPYTLTLRTRAIAAPGAACDPDRVVSRCASGHRCVDALCVEDSAELACAQATDVSAAVAGGSFAISAATYPYAPDHHQGSCAFDPEAGNPEDIYRFTLDQTRRFVASTDFDATALDTVLYLRAGDCDGPEIGCHDDVDLDESNLRSVLEVEALAPGTYVLIVDGASTDSGTGAYRLQMTWE